MFLYDNYPGGIGLAAPLHDQRESILRRAWQLVQACACAHGCPSCIGPVMPRGDGPELNPKRAALRILELLAGETNLTITSDAPQH